MSKVESIIKSLEKLCENIEDLTYKLREIEDSTPGDEMEWEYQAEFIDGTITCGKCGQEIVGINTHYKKYWQQIFQRCPICGTMAKKVIRIGIPEGY